MAVNKNWARWIFASVSKHFKDTCVGLNFFAEGEDQKVQDFSDYIEFRMNGPTICESSGFYHLGIVANILVVSKFNKSSIHTIHKNVGIVEAAFTKCITVRRYGLLTEDSQNDGSVLGVLQLKPYDKKDVNTSHFGQVNPEIKEMQSTVEGYYCMLLES
jgi:hypothetical protein